MIELKQYTQLPDNFFDLSPDRAIEGFPTPSLVHLEGEKEERLLVSVLLHGNETTSWLAVQKLLARYQNKKLPRSLSLFIGNVEAAQKGVRRLDRQEDFNRIWTHEGASHGNLLAQKVFSLMREQPLFSAVDIHNNTGKNPYYVCFSQKDLRFIELGQAFSHTFVYFKRPQEVFSTFFSSLCPSVTIEAGKSGDEEGVKKVVDYLDYCLTDLEWGTPVSLEELLIYKSVAGILVSRGYSLRFDKVASNADITLVENIEDLNFHDLESGSLLGWYQREEPLMVVDTFNNDVTEEYLEFSQGQIRLKKRMTPAMFTKDIRVINQDCLGYLMERMSDV